MSRPDWDTYFMDIARLVATRSTCLRRQVGAVIVRDKRILTTGYNGAPMGLKHCEEIGGCMREKLNVPSGQRHEICRATHAEQNAIIQASRIGISIENSIIYSTTQPCSLCAKLIINAGIKEVYITETYPDDMTLELFKEASVKLISLG